jgi:dihydrolipoamide dehydrogenase
MGSRLEIRVPDLGEVDEVDVVEILVAVGDSVEIDEGLVTLESDKASMDVPTTAAGVVKKIALGNGAKAKAGDLVVVLEVEEAPAKAAEPIEAATEEASPPEQTAPPVPPAPSVTLPEADIQTEVLVLGSGPGGYTAAFRAADLGKSVVMVERHSVIGGVCLNVGCIPSKALLHVGRVIEEAADLGSHGVNFGEPEVDLDKLREFKDGVVSRLTKGLASMAKAREVQVVTGLGRFTSANTLMVEGEDGETSIAFEQAIIAAGSRVVQIPGIPWDDPRVIDSTGALQLADVPERLLVVGGGIIGLEMAMVYGSLGSHLTVVEMLDGLIPGCDPDLVKPLERRLKRRFKAKVHVNTKVSEIRATENGLEADFEGAKAPDTQTFDRVLVAVGRRPNGDRIGAEAAGVEVDERGFIGVDKQQRTNVSHIFAIGDIVGQPMLAHKATHEAKVAAEVAAGEKSSFDARVIPSVAYTDPEIAWVGLTETQAAATGTAYEKGTFPWSASGRSLGMGRSDGMTKILFDPTTHKVLGAGIVGPHAGDLIAELALAIEMDADAGDLALTVHPHPTLSETVALAAEVYEGTVTDLYLPKK